MLSRKTMILHTRIMSDLLEDMFKHSHKAYESLMAIEDNHRYLISAYNLSIAHNSFIQFKTFYETYEHEHRDIDPIIKAFNDFKFQFDEVITDKDDNTSWLDGMKVNLDNTYKEVKVFFDDYIKINS